ncbi:Gfo/Idh/MocA family protein [Microtetraspora malaysiensis]|uniref:Gfo/Idh/MocA family protein n=1 Tax=Microtetraspora malaysiensis TaxID=161358 RepID=UPI003D94190D
MSATRVGMFGHGWWARRYLAPALSGAGGELVAICGRDGARAAKAASEFGVARSFDRIEAMLESVELDALVIASPPSSHAAAVRAVAAAGLPVFCEKPLGRTSEETAGMVAACVGLPTVVGFTQRWNPAIRTARRLLAEGAIGDVRHVRYSTASALSADAAAPWDWRYCADEYAYGVLSDLGPHAVDVVRWLGGEITEVAADAHTVFAERSASDGRAKKVENWDECSLSVRLADGVRASLFVSRVLPVSPYRRFHHQLEVLGSRGTLAYDSDRPVEVVLSNSGGRPSVVRADGLDTGDAEPGSFDELMAVMDASAAAQARDMLAVFSGRAPAGVPALADGHAGQLVLDAAARSVAAQAWVRC